ncbi:MAG TPA: Ig-like domain-containing protein, partial [Casimicrobiaceae bacterium]|nr:Ig-like domain-containing protein [Casimicrobiaceae bacterium]
VTFTATDATDGVTLAQTTKVSFVAPPAASGGIVALPSTVAANGSSTTTITVTLLDANGQGAVGKTVTLSQGSGHSVITGPSPAVTNASGQVTFMATDTTAETVTYTAVDVTDNNLPVPGSASVSFTGGNASCLPAPPAAANGFTLIPFANGFVAQNFFFGNINFTGCPGASNPAFDGSGNVFVSDFPTGDLYKFGSSGGAVSSANKLSNLGKTFGNLVIGKDGNLYGTTFSPSAIVQVDAVTGAVVKTVASGYTCPSSLAVDPLSGDLFFDDGCTGGGSDNPSIWRIQNPGSNTPTVVVYATLPQTPGGGIAFAPDGTLFAVANGFNNANSPVVRFTGTNTPAPHDGVVVQGITADTGGIAVGEVNPNGSAKSLIVHNGGAAGGVGGSLKLFDLTTLNATVLATGIVDPGVTGPDGCMYVNGHDTILKLVPTSGVCSFASTNPSPALILSASSLTPTQGTTVTLTAKVNNVSTPVGTPVMFVVSGPNAQIKLGNTDASGVATVTVLGKFAGSDSVQATTAIGNTNLKSSLLRLTWNAGRHATFTTLNLSPNAASAGTSVTLVASVSDVSVAPATAVQGVSVMMAIGAQSCSGVTDAQGNARCSVVVPPRPGSGPPLMLSATFAGNAQYTASSDAEPFVIVGALGASPPGAPTIGTATAGAGFASVSFTPPGSDGGSPITSYSAICTPVGGGSAVTASGASSPIIVSGLTAGVTYTCTVSATNSAGTGAASGSSNAVTILTAMGPQLPTNIPTLNVWMLMLLACVLLAMGAAEAARRRRDRG